MRLPLLAVTMACTISAQFSTPTPPDCANYAVAPLADGTFACERYATFPWFAAGQGWSTQVAMFTAPESGQLRGVQFQIGLGPGASVKAVYGGLAGTYGNFTFVQPPVLAGSSARLDILTAAFGTTDLAYGPLWVQMDAPDVQTLEAANLQLIFLFTDSTGKYNTQLAVPPIFNDQAAPAWITSFSETPVDKKATAANSNDCSFAVANLTAQPQSVTVSLYDQSGNLLAQQTTPVLAAGIQTGAQVIPGGVYGIDFGSFFGLTSSALTSPTGTIDGTVQFASSAGLPIAPLVIRLAGNSISTFQIAPLRPFIPPVE
ncbi:MAG TPA: hypothetical protein VLM42_12940 [Bryobacteraceae bacterium]|nr:hypothetical protein [Bryobacteraceae bacterium]